MNASVYAFCQPTTVRNLKFGMFLSLCGGDGGWDIRPPFFTWTRYVRRLIHNKLWGWCLSYQGIGVFSGGYEVGHPPKMSRSPAMLTTLWCSGCDLFIYVYFCDMFKNTFVLFFFCFGKLAERSMLMIWILWYWLQCWWCESGEWRLGGRWIAGWWWRGRGGYDNDARTWDCWTHCSGCHTIAAWHAHLTTT